MDFTTTSKENQGVAAWGKSGGLSKSHISPLNPEIGLRNIEKWLSNPRKGAVLGNLANLTVWRGSSLVRVQRDWLPGDQIGGGVRGRISGFSENSRRRLMYRLAKIERGGLPVLVTLTYPDCYYERLERFENWKRDIDTLGKRISRAFPGAGACWKMEIIDRKSGLYKGVMFPHFHLLIWGVGVDLLREFISLAWFQVVKTGDIHHFKAGTRVEQVRTENGVRSYVSKYLCKTAAENTRYLGRWWGFIGKKNLPWAVASCVRLCDFEAEMLICAMVKRMAIPDRRYITLQFMCDAEEVLRGWEDVLFEGYQVWENARKIRKSSSAGSIPIAE